MTNDEFNALVERELSRIRDTLTRKGDEYQRGENRLSNFVKGAEDQRATLLRDCLGKMVKHWSSVVDLVCDHERDGRLAPGPTWDEKLGDLMCYCLLLRACAEEVRNADR